MTGSHPREDTGRPQRTGSSYYGTLFPHGYHACMTGPPKSAFKPKNYPLISHISQFHSLGFHVSPKLISAQALTIQEGFSLSGRGQLEKTIPLQFKASHIVGAWVQDSHCIFFFPSHIFTTTERNLNEKICENVSDLP